VCVFAHVLFVYYFNLCRQSDLTSLIHNKGLYSTFPNVSIGERSSFEWRYGEEQIAMTYTDKLLSTPALELLSVESDLLDNIHV